MENTICISFRTSRLCVPRRRTEFADLSVSALLYRSSMEDVKPLEDSVSEAICIRQDLACGAEAYKVRKSICVGATRADSGDEVANKTALQYCTSLNFLSSTYLLQFVSCLQSQGRLFFQRTHRTESCYSAIILQID